MRYIEDWAAFLRWFLVGKCHRGVYLNRNCKTQTLEKKEKNTKMYESRVKQNKALNTKSYVVIPSTKMQIWKSTSLEFHPFVRISFSLGQIFTDFSAWSRSPHPNFSLRIIPTCCNSDKVQFAEVRSSFISSCWFPSYPDKNLKINLR